jgi:hypothetical protein
MLATVIDMLNVILKLCFINIRRCADSRTALLESGFVGTLRFRVR